jgi:prephenate dehydratase
MIETHGQTALPGGATYAIYALGPEGTFSDRAAQRLAVHLGETGLSPRIVYTTTIPEALNRAIADPAGIAVVPIENSDSGSIAITQDLLGLHPLLIEWEIQIRVRFGILARTPLDEVEELLVHPVAHAQCSLFLSDRLPMANAILTSSNTDSGEQFFRAGDGARRAAIVPIDYAERFPELTKAVDIQNDKQNTTRFLAVRVDPRNRVPDLTRARASLVVEPSEDRPGLLHDLLGVFRRYGINLCRIESRPARTRPWAYVFYLDIDNNEHSAAALSELRASAGTVRLLGAYDVLD